MARLYVKLDSWHEAEVLDEDDVIAIAAGVKRTRCGLEVPGGSPSDSELPLDEKSCESCLRLARHDAESPANPDADDGTVVDDEPLA